jgi:hypothetical protein
MPIDFTWNEIRPPQPARFVRKHGNCIRWSTEMDETLREMRKQGHSRDAIGERVGVSECAVKRRMTELGLSLQQPFLRRRPARLWSHLPAQYL